MSVVLIKSLNHKSQIANSTLIPGKRGFTKCEYRSDFVHYLSYTEAQPIQLVQVCENPEVLIVMTLEGSMGMISRENVEFYQDSHLLLLDFYHGYTRSETVENFMKDAQPGSYLLRNSNQIPNGLSLDIRCSCPDGIHRIRIINEKSLFFVCDEVFKDIGEVLKNTTYHPHQPEYETKYIYPIPTKNFNRDYIVAKTLVKNRQYLRNASVVTGDIIGGGQYGDIFKGKYNGKDVAVKCVKSSLIEDKAASFFADEVALMHELYHKNVVHFVGCVISNQRIVKVVMEWCDNGDLHSYIVKNPNVSSIDRLIFCEQVADGLKYVHIKNIVHGDIAARNILLTKEMVPKITDFGLSSYEKKVIPPKTMVPKRWMAPESMQSKVINRESDVWSFGVLMWEVYSNGLCPYMEHNPVHLYDVVGVQEIKLIKTENCSEDVYSIMLDCWQINVQQRKNIAEIYENLKTTRENYQISLEY